MLGEKLVEKMTKWKKITENCILHSYELKKFSPPPPLPDVRRGSARALQTYSSGEKLNHKGGRGDVLCLGRKPHG